MPSTNKVLFLDPWSGPRSIRDKNLQSSRAKAHAAKVSHPKTIQSERVLKSHDAKAWDVYRPDLTIASVSTDGLKRGTPPPKGVVILTQRRRSRAEDDEISDKAVQVEPTIASFSHLNPEDFRRCQNATNWQWINGTRLDPFDCIPGSNEPAAATALEFFIHYLRWKVDIIHGVFQVSNLWGPWLLEYMAGKPHLFYAVVAFMSNTINLLIHKSEASATAIVLYKTKALAHLRQCISSPQAIEDDSVIMAIFVLSVMESMGGEMIAYAVHRKKLYALVASRGGIDGLTKDRNVRAFLCQLEPWRTIDISGKSTKCTYPGQPFDPSFCQEICSMPSGFRDLALAGKLSYATIRVVRNIHGLSNQNNTAKLPSRGDIPSSQPQFDSFAEACPALTLPDGPLFEPPMEKLLCLGLICFRTNSSKFYKHNGAWLHHVLTSRLIRYFPQIIPTWDDTPTRNALLWISLILITSCCDEVNILGPDKQALQLLVLLREKFPECRGWDTIQYYLSISERFFWNDILTDRLRHLLDKLPEEEVPGNPTEQEIPGIGRVRGSVDSDLFDSQPTWAEQYPAF